MALFNDNVRKQLQEILSKLKSPVKLILFTQEFECTMCKDTHLFLEEISSLSDKLNLVVYDFVKDANRAKSFGVDKIPAIVILDSEGNDSRIRFYGIPAGYEINSFMQSLLETSGEREHLSDDLEKRIRALEKDVHIQVFVSLTCPYCPAAVSVAHRLALENHGVRADMVETSAFPHLAQRYSISGVPRTVINGVHFLDGAQPLSRVVEYLEKI